MSQEEEVKINKEELLKKVKSGEYKTVSKDSSRIDVWKYFKIIMDDKSNPVNFVICLKCDEILKYDSWITGTSSLTKHLEACMKPTEERITQFFNPVSIRSEVKDQIADSAALMCAQDLRPFEFVAGAGLIRFAQDLINIGATRGKIDAKELLPHPTTVSRHVKLLADNHRIKLISFIKNSESPIYGSTLDFWKNTSSNEEYLKVSIHFFFDFINNEHSHYTLYTNVFLEDRTAINIYPKLVDIFLQYGLDLKTENMVFVSDNGSNIVCALKEEAHLPCVCHCLNLAIKFAFDEAPDNIKELIEACKRVVGYWKHAGIKNT